MPPEQFTPINKHVRWNPRQVSFKDHVGPQSFIACTSLTPFHRKQADWCKNNPWLISQDATKSSFNGTCSSKLRLAPYLSIKSNPIKIFSATLLEYFSSLFVHKSLESLSFRPLKCFVSLATEREKQKFAKFCFSHFIRKNTFFDTKVLKHWVHFLTTVPINLWQI